MTNLITKSVKTTTLNNKIDEMAAEYGISFNDYNFPERISNKAMLAIILDREDEIKELIAMDAVIDDIMTIEEARSIVTTPRYTTNATSTKACKNINIKIVNEIDNPISKGFAFEITIFNMTSHETVRKIAIVNKRNKLVDTFFI